MSSKEAAVGLALALAVNGVPVAAPAAWAQTQESEAVGETKAEPRAVPSALAAGSGEPVVLLQGLDKITARVSTFKAQVSQMTRFGTLQIMARHCYRRPPTEPPESAAFLEIVDQHPDAPPVELFTGWMFASSPALSGLEHPVYDVWVLDCLADRAEAPTETPATQ